MYQSLSINVTHYHIVDKRIIARPAIREALIKDFQEAVRQGGEGAADDLIRNHGRRWG